MAFNEEISFSETTLLELQAEEQLLEKEKTKRSSSVGVAVFNKLFLDLNVYDEVGLCRRFLRNSISHNLPWVAAKTLMGCGGNLFHNALRPRSPVTVPVVWDFIWDIVAALQEKGFFEQSADVLSYAASNWPLTPDQKLEVRLRAAAAFDAAKGVKEACEEILGAAEIAVALEQPWRAYRLYWDAANILRSDPSQESNSRAIHLLQRARAIANSDAEYSQAGLIVLEQKYCELQNLLYSLGDVCGLKKARLLIRIVVWWFFFLTCGHYERPWRVLGFGAMVIFVFAVLYFPDLGLVHLRGAAEGDFLERAVTSLHFSAITFTTVGYGNIYPEDAAGKLLTALEALLELWREVGDGLTG
jgi:hypothetical protein